MRGRNTAFAIWKVILDLFYRNSLRNQLATRRVFYLVEMEDSKNCVTFFSRVCQLAANLKSGNAQGTDQNVAMAILNDLPRKFELSLCQCMQSLMTEE